MARADVVEVGDPESTTIQYTVPVNMYYNYSLTQQIYPACEIGMAGTINSIAFDYTYTGSYSMENVQVYMMLTEKTSFETTTDMVALDDATLVWEGTFAAEEDGWVTLELTTPFVLDGTNNLLVCCYDPTNGYPGSSYKFRTTATDDYLALAYYSDSQTPSLTDVSTFSGSKVRYQYRNNIQLDITPDPDVVLCCPPSNLTVPTDELTAHEARLMWEGDAAEYIVGYKTANEEEWTEFGVNGTQTLLTDLEQSTTYHVRVKSFCGEESSSTPITTNFTTLVACPAPTGLAVTLTSGDGTVAELNWTENGTTTEWDVEYDTDPNFSTLTVVNASGTPTVTLENLTPETPYYARVKAYCGSEGYSVYSNVVSFTPTDAYSFTVNDANDTNGFVPVYGYYADQLSKSQFIIPAADLETMQWGVISKLTFYATQANISWGAAEFEVYMTEVNYTTFEDATLVDWTTMTKVMDAGSLSINNNVMEVTLDAPYQYMGDNLMIGIKQTTKGSFVTSTWYGVIQEGNTAIGGYENSKGLGLRSFLPKTTFAYTPGEVPACLPPTGLSTSDVTAHEATISWTSDAEAWQVMLNDDEENLIDVTENPYTFTNLDPETAYTAKVRTNCDGIFSEWSNPVNFTTGIACPAPTDLICTAITATTTTLSWTDNANATLWEVQYSTTNDFDSYTSVSASDTPSVTIEDLTPETIYYARVMANCEEEGTSSFSNVVSFEPTAKFVVGTETGTNQFIPTYTFYNYSLNQQIYTAEELGEAGLIESIDFYCASAPSNSTRLIDIYMVSTEKNSFDSSNDWITVTANDLVYSGSRLFTTGWNSFVFDEPFIYDGTRNVALIIDDNTGGYNSTDYFSVYDATAQTLRVYSDPTDYDPTAPSSYIGIILNVKNQLRVLKSEMPDCVKPTRLTATEIGADYVVLSWDQYGDVASWNVEITGDYITTWTATEIPFTVPGLSTEMEYSVRVSPDCDENLWSGVITFTTPDYSIFTKDITGYGTGTGNWYLIASPIGTINPTEVTNMFANEYDLYAFQQVNDQEWLNYKFDMFDLESGKGYLYANSEDVTLTFVGVPYNGDGEVVLEKVDNTNMSGWNLVGNPFTETAYIGDRDFYIMNAGGTEIIKSTSPSIEAMEGIFVIAENDGEILTFSTEIPAKSAMLSLNLSQGRNIVDCAAVRFGVGRNLPKLQLNPNSTKVYIPMDNVDYAVVLSESTGELPVNFKTESNGSYTLSFNSEEVEFNYLHLIDNLTGEDVDLLAIPNYTFNARATDNANRFRLVFDLGTTGIDENFAYYNNGSFVINSEGEATLQVIDITGRIIKSETITGSANVNMNAAPGVYMLRLINGDTVMVQKVVVK